LNGVAAAHGLRFWATLVDDGSTEAAAWPADLRADLSCFSDVEILHLRGNRGQPLAVTVGLAHLLRRQQGRPVLLMDADGQDRAADVPALIAAFGEDPSRLLMAARRDRTEGPVFRLGYNCFQILFRLLAGRAFRIGIFGIYPVAQIEALLRFPSLQRSIAGTVIASGLAGRFVETDRGKRTHGRSRFGLRGHIRHAWGILAANRERIFSRVSRASGVASAIALAATILHAALAGSQPMDGWTAFGLILAVLCGALSVGLAMRRSSRRRDAMPTPQALCTEHVAEACAGSA
jgi:hypothetical protein